MASPIKDIIRKAREAGWTVEQTKDTHYWFRSPNGKDAVLIGRNLGDWRAVKNALAELRRRGLDIRSVA